MTTVKIFFTIVFLVIAILSLLYGIAIYSIRSGSKFYTVWFALSALSLILCTCTIFGLFAKIPKPVRIGGLIVVALAFLTFLYTQIRILTYFNDKAPSNLDYIVVLGAQMRPDGPSVVLQFRLDTAAQYLKDNPDTICIVSGGMGPNETEPEAYGMRDYLISKGIDPARILIEDRSGNTIQNILFSKELMDEEHSSVGIVTNNFHVYRGVALARKQGFSDVCGIPAPSSPAYLPNNMLREFVGILKDTLQGNMNFF